MHNVFPWDIFEAAPNMSPVKILELDISFFSLCSSLNWRVRPLVPPWACYRGLEKYETGARFRRFRIIHFFFENGYANFFRLRGSISSLGKKGTGNGPAKLKTYYENYNYLQKNRETDTKTKAENFFAKRIRKSIRFFFKILPVTRGRGRTYSRFCASNKFDAP